MTKTFAKYGLTAAALMPFLSLAADFDSGYGDSLFDALQGWVEAIIPILMTLALAYFIYGLIKYIYAAGRGDAEAAKIGKGIMIWGVVALFVMASIWGIVSVLQGITGTDDSSSAPSADDLIPD